MMYVFFLFIIVFFYLPLCFLIFRCVFLFAIVICISGPLYFLDSDDKSKDA